MNTNRDDSVKNALDDIFGTNFIEVDSKEKVSSIEEKDEEIIEAKEVESNIIYNDNISPKEILDELDNAPENDNLEKTILLKPINQDLDNTLNIEIPFVDGDYNIDNIEAKKEPSPIEKKSLFDLIEPKDENLELKVKVEKESYDKAKKMMLIYFLVGIVLGTILIALIVSSTLSKEKTINCSSLTEDVGYKITDEYKITYKNNKINYIEGNYIYTALNNEYKSQLNAIKEEKLPVIINSNGVSGFTHIYEISDSYFKVESYYDFEKFDFSKIDKNNSKVTPLSYIDINSKTTFKSLKNDLKKLGYKCVSSK